MNETKREVEDAWKWTALRQTINIPTEDTVSQYAITGAGDRWKLQDKNFSVYNSTQNYFLKPQPAAYVKYRALASAPDTNSPSEFYFEGRDSNGDPYVNVFPTPDGVHSINYNLVVPQDDFDMGTEVLLVPSWPVILGAYAKAIAERGEDNGKTHGEAMNKFDKALGDAIAMDEALTTGESTWYA